ncbi:alpha/beta hydrolase [Mumia sp. ZJ1417]|uniref:alpha/beta fold hydrolase n=1 Tax=unclassified Mumia TaxID=2621872 RepID=UPI00141E55A6|nr:MULTISPECIES: alpha/beta hydrolase [unclassified Mumia]QMW65312.1 alpha/beta hydrolase [Mumia sp. ZJ1417]
MTRPYRTIDVPVPGGDLRVGVWDAGDPSAPTLLLVHGVTASHRSWDLLAERLPEVRLVAPDLRGRGRSNGVEGPAGMTAHARDLVAVLDAVGADAVTVIGHSMGGFVACVLADQFPDRVGSLVLLDGGLPLDVPEGLNADEVIATVLGPTAERLAMEFADVEAYFAFWRRHPAFADGWSSELEDYFAYDLVGEPPALRAATSYATMSEDTVDLNAGAAPAQAIAHLRHSTLFVTVPRGLLDEKPGLYADERIPALLADKPTIRHHRVDDANHYTLVLSARGADAVAELVRDEVALTTPETSHP